MLHVNYVAISKQMTRQNTDANETGPSVEGGTRVLHVERQCPILPGEDQERETKEGVLEWKPER